MSPVRKIKSYVRNFLLLHLPELVEIGPRGVTLFQDISNYLPTYEVETIFDVGANVGQSAKQYLQWFPQSTLYCFEPASAAFRQLQTSLQGNAKARCFQIALSSTKGTGRMVLQGRSELSFLLDSSKAQAVTREADLETVEVETLDNFCRTNNILHISFLKVDTEGADLEVLKGAETLLNEHRIDLVEVEVGMNPRNERHVPFETAKAHFESKNYFLFGLYEQIHEWPTKAPHLRRANVVFLSERLIKANTWGKMGRGLNSPACMV
jgi:FkbM family methyltransferase